MITATGSAAPALKAASLEPFETRVSGCCVQRSRLFAREARLGSARGVAFE